MLVLVYSCQGSPLQHTGTIYFLSIIVVKKTLAFLCKICSSFNIVRMKYIINHILHLLVITLPMETK